ncbi:hypothetical protein BJX61DRAFT_533101 [Aspergillus egyptiacus]|nr:hypothetical protein BJX61DRAFT_533101 [Aspergillus egyptiacus]
MRLLPTLTLLTLTTPSQRHLNFAAHEDDDLLFLHAEIIHKIEPRPPRLGLSPDYWTYRQAGTLSAYAQMAGVSNTWDENDLGVPDKDTPLYTLREREHISKGMRLFIGTVDDGSTSGTRYMRGPLISTLAFIIGQYNPERVNALNYVGGFGSWDFSGAVVGYIGYDSQRLVANLVPEDWEKKKRAFYTYAGFDGMACASDLYEVRLWSEYPRN